MRNHAVSVAIITALLLPLGATAQAAEKPDPPNRTGCCFSFDHSPVQVFFCNVPGACVVEPPK